MYSKGDLIIYGKMGVCRVGDITVPPALRHGGDRLYYVLQPMRESCVVYAPVNTKVFMRPIVSAEEANRLIDAIPSRQADAYYNDRLQELVLHYEEALYQYGCEDLIALAMSIYAKKQEMHSQSLKFGLTDEKYLKQAEDLLCCEFSLALGIPEADVPEYIAARVQAAGRREMT